MRLFYNFLIKYSFKTLVTSWTCYITLTLYKWGNPGRKYVSYLREWGEEFSILGHIPELKYAKHLGEKFIIEMLCKLSHCQ